MNSEMFSPDEMLNHGMSDPALYSAINKILRTQQTDETKFPSRLPSDMTVTMAYVPLQFYTQDYKPNEGFDRGTIFPELDKPFMPGDMR